MTDKEILSLKLDEMEPEEARIIGIDLLREDIDADKAVTKKGALIAAVLTAGMLLAGMDTIPAYAIMGVDSMVLYSVFDKLQAIHKKKKQLKQYEQGTFQGDYKDFLREVQRYAQARERALEAKEKRRNK